MLRFPEPWMLWMKSLAFAAQPLLDWFGRWHHEQVAASLRWPAWKSGPTPSVTWQPAHLVLSTIWRRPVNPVATLDTSGGGTISPPMPPKPLAFGVYRYRRSSGGRLLSISIWVNGCVLLANVGGEPRP